MSTRARQSPSSSSSSRPRYSMGQVTRATCAWRSSWHCSRLDRRAGVERQDTEEDAKYLAQRAYNAHCGKRLYEAKLSRGLGVA
jgi:hypothetical protein